MSETKTITRKLFLFGEGAMQLPSLASGESDTDKAKTAAAAGFGIGYHGPWFSGMGSVRKGSNETVEAGEDEAGNVLNPPQANIGNSIFSPQTSNMNIDLKLSYHPIPLNDEGSNSPFRSRLGFYGYTAAGGFMWEYPSENDVQREESMEAQPFSLGVGPSVRWSGTALSNDLTLNLNVGYAARLIGGNAGTHTAERRRLIGTSTRYFHGPEVAFGVTLGNLTFGVSLTYLFPAKKDDEHINNESSNIDGLTGLRFTPVITAIGPLTLGEWE